MNRMTWWLLCWLVQSSVSPIITCTTSCPTPMGNCLQNKQGCNKTTSDYSKRQCRKLSESKCCMEEVNNSFSRKDKDTISAVKDLEEVLEETEVNETTSISAGHLVALLHKPQSPFKGLNINANGSQAMLDKTSTKSTVSVQLPELDLGSDNMIVFCMITAPETNWTALGASDLYEGRLVGLSVRDKNISGLQERVNITMTLTMGINETQKPTCVFFNFSTTNFGSDGCRTLWKRNESYITCSCDHLTYFGVLLVEVNSVLPPADLKILTYITQIGCSLSLFALVITVLLFIVNRKLRADVSMKVHISLTVALILLNLHFLPSQFVAAQSSTGLCVYMALALHYSLLATFSWMALEGFHIYLLLVRVFNIYVSRYLLKLSLVGWGLPAVIVSLVVIIDRGTYGPVSLDSDSTAICYIGNNTVKMVTTVGVFCLVFVFNIIMLLVTVRHVMSFRQRRQFGQSDSDRAKRDICTLLGVTILLGITWGLIFFSFGYLTIPGLYLFCILNSLQGFFIFLWFVMSLRKSGNSASSETHTSNN